MKSRFFSTFAAALLLSVLVAPASHSHAAGFEVLRPHRAIYDLTLKEATERSGIQAMNGRIVYEITGNACEGMSVRYRFVSNISTPENSYQTDQQTTTFESPDGKEFNFLTRTFVNSQPERTVRGVATRTPEGLEVELSKPKERQLELSDGIFISSHLVELIENASDGKQFVQHSIFDGSEDADEVVTGSSVIGEAKPYTESFSGEAEEAVRKLDGMMAWPVTVSYFENANSAKAERLPVYEASFLLYPNGVSRRLTMRYDDYTLSGQLTGLEMIDWTECE